jgi:AcrR family transcriptional regulator
MARQPDPVPALPPGIELAWGRQTRATRGPKPALTLTQIVDEAIAIASTEGLGALSMARVAKSLGTGTMSLYRYVESKDDLLTLMVDTGLGRPIPRAKNETWRDGLTRWARGVYGRYLANPWSLQVPITGPPLGPNNVAWLEDALSSLTDTHLTEQQKLSSVLLVSGFARNAATLTADMARAAAGENVMPGYVELLKLLTDPAEFPSLHRALESGSLGDDDDIQAEFDFGLERTLDGIEALVDRG